MWPWPKTRRPRRANDPAPKIPMLTAPALRIGFDATAAVSQGGGIGRYTRELLRALAAADQENAYRVFFASRTQPYPLPPLPPSFHVTRLPFHDIWLARLWQRAQAPLPVDWVTGPIDLFHSPDFTLPPVRRGTRTLLTVHDLSFVRDPASAAPGLRDYLNVVVPRSVARADHILADSAATKTDLLELYQTPSDKISVLYCGIQASFRPVTNSAMLAAVRQAYGLGAAPFILAVSTLQPRKNYTRLIQAFARLNRPEVRLVIAGGKGWLFEEIFAEVERLRLKARVLFPGFVADADLPALYSAARVLAYPSLYEGFGLPMLEAMACGTPVVASTASCLPEVAGDAAWLVPPTDVDALAQALDQALSDETARAEMRLKGQARAAQFSWANSANQLLRIYRELVVG
jgi:glycosyltransferase involved in cell wall biosynthesis